MTVLAETPITSSRSEMQIAADTICALFRAGLLSMTPNTISQVSLACRVPVRDIREGWRRSEAGTRPTPSRALVGADQSAMPSAAKPDGRRRPNRIIPDDATEWRCGTCHKVKPIDQFDIRADKGSRRTTCRACRKRYQRDHYLSVETSRRLGTILRFVVKTGDACEGDDCPRCHRSLLEGQEVVADDVQLRHASCVVRS